MIPYATPIIRRFAITSVLVTLMLIARDHRATAADTADGPALMQKVRDDIAWVGKLKSFHLMARIEERRTPEGIENDLRKIKNQFPGLDKFDPLKFTELLSAINVRLELDFDERRLRHCWLSRDDDSNRALSRDLRMWDGRREIYHDQHFPEKRDRVLIRSERKLASQGFWGWCIYLNQQPLVCWWNDNPEQREQLRGFGEPSDFVLVDRADFHGVDCHVLLDARHGYRDRYYVGVQDGRCYGVKQGAASFVNVANFRETNQRLIEESLGRSLGANPSDDVWKTVYQHLEALPVARRAELGKRYYSAITKEVTPVWEIWYSNFRDLGEGRFLPFRETSVFYGSDEEDKRIFVRARRTVFVRNVTLNQPLDEGLFEEAIAEVAEIVDETSKGK